LGADRKAQLGYGLVKEPRPRGPASDRFLVQQLLDLVAELIGAKGTRVAQPGRVMGERRGLELLLELCILDAI
jgi:hypothetical protein